MSDDDLDLVETTVLVDALYRRLGPHGALVVISLHDRTADQEGTKVSYRGGWCTCLGMMVEQVGKCMLPVHEPPCPGDA